MSVENKVRDWKDQNLIGLLSEKHEFEKISQTINGLKRLDEDKKCAKRISTASDELEMPSREIVSNHLDFLREKGIVERKGTGKYNRKLYDFTTEGEIVAKRITKLFESISESKNIEEELKSFKQLYLKNPTVNEFSNFATPVSEDELRETSIYWEPEEYEENGEGIVEKIVLAAVIKNSSAKDYLGVDPRGITQIGFSESNQDNFDKTYIQNNSEFIEELKIEHNTCGRFRIKLDEVSENILGQSMYLFEISEPEKVEKEMEEIAEESSF